MTPIPAVVIVFAVLVFVASPVTAGGPPPCDIPDSPDDTCQADPVVELVDCLATATTWKECLEPRP